MKRLLRAPPTLDFIQSATQKPRTPPIENGINTHKPIEIKSGYLLDYCGSIDIGSEGDVKQIEKAIKQLIHPGNINFVPIRFECLELGIKVTQDSDEKVIE